MGSVKVEPRAGGTATTEVAKGEDLSNGSFASSRSSISQARRELAVPSEVSSDSAFSAKGNPSGVDINDRRVQGLLRQIENSPHRDQLKKLESQLHKVDNPEEAAKIITRMRALITGATGSKSLEQFEKEGMGKLLKELEKATKEVEESFGYSIRRPSTLVPFVRTNEQEKAVKAWTDACDKLQKYIKDNVGQLTPDSHSQALAVASEAVMDGVRKIHGLTAEEIENAQSGMAVAGGVMAASGTVLAGYLAFQAARTKNPNFIAAAAGFAAMNLEHDRFIKDLATTSKSWDEYKKRYADGFEDAAKRAAMTGLVVGVATLAILNLKAGAVPVSSLTPSMMATYCGALATSLEVTFGAKLAQDVLVNVSKGICDVVGGLAEGNENKQREGWKALGDAGIDTVQLGFLGKLIEGWKPAPTASKPKPQNPRPSEPINDPESAPNRKPTPTRSNSTQTSIRVPHEKQLVLSEGDFEALARKIAPKGDLPVALYDSKSGKLIVPRSSEPTYGGQPGSNTALSEIDTSGLQPIVVMSTSKVRTTQVTIKGSETEKIAASMKKDGFIVKDPKVEFIDVVDVGDGTFSSIDNKRIVAAEAAGVPVVVRVHSPQEPIDPSRFPPDVLEQFFRDPKTGELAKTWGDAIRIRVERQRSTREGKEWYSRVDSPWGSVTDRPRPR